MKLKLFSGSRSVAIAIGSLVLLSCLLRAQDRLGLNQKGAAQAALFATKQVDPGAPTYSLDFLRMHPEISIESSPWHVHKQLLPEGAAPAGSHWEIEKEQDCES